MYIRAVGRSENLRGEGEAVIKGHLRNNTLILFQQQKSWVLKSILHEQSKWNVIRVVCCHLYQQVLVVFITWTSLRSSERLEISKNQNELIDLYQKYVGIELAMVFKKNMLKKYFRLCFLCLISVSPEICMCIRPISTHFHPRSRRLCIRAAAGADRFHGNKHNKLLQLN